MRRSIPAALLAFALLAPAASAARAQRDLWATVNVCDASANPNRLGVRARMPGDGTRGRMYMRFTAQYRTGSAWRTVRGRGVSRWFYAGSALFRNEELGYTFSLDPPAAGTAYVMRGLVDFEWRARERHGGRTRTVVKRRAQAQTSVGHPTSASVPAGFTAARCRLEAPPAG